MAAATRPDLENIILTRECRLFDFQNDCLTAEMKDWLQGVLIVPDDSEIVETGKRKLSRD
jgi:hypothetical protein